MSPPRRPVSAAGGAGVVVVVVVVDVGFEGADAPPQLGELRSGGGAEPRPAPGHRS